MNATNKKKMPICDDLSQGVVAPPDPLDPPRPAYTGDPESCGDGNAWAYLGRTASEIMEHVENWIASDPEPGATMTITMRMMTDEDVRSLPTL